MTSKEEIARDLAELALKYGLFETVFGVFGNKVRVALPVTKETCEAPVGDLDLSVRAMNGLKRADCFTIGKLIDIVNADGIRMIRNLGEKSQREIKLKLFEYLYGVMPDRERRLLFLDMIELNTRKISSRADG